MKHSKPFLSPQILSFLFLILLFSIPVQSEPKPEETKSLIVETNTEIVSDFLWRGNSFVGESQNRRNGAAYQSFTYAPALQPSINVWSPEKKFQWSLFGNFQLTNRDDIDSDKRILQSRPGGVGPSYLGEETKFYDPYNQDPCVQSLHNKISTGAEGSDPCLGYSPNQGYGPKKEPNGNKRADGLFFSMSYHFDPTSLGEFAVGIWFYNTFQKTPNSLLSPGTQKQNPNVSGGPNNTFNANNPNAISRLTWHEYFVHWQLPFLKKFKPTISYFTQYSTENGGLMAGKNYLSFSGSYTFREEKFFRIMPHFNLGYAMGNNAVDNRYGIQDITTSTSFFFGDFFIKFAHIFRPDLYLWDTNNYYGYAGGDPNKAHWNRSSEDGKVTNPSRVYGAYNTSILNAIEQIDTGNSLRDAYVKTWLRETYTLQNIPAHLFYVSLGYSKTF
ncbi:hypothetical protein [Leptospira kanakyensis]|uniref:hypothetical protein n=1 Tax=Leptospira kanakyensis TaxID=2484968 RepID=UPI00223C8E33|nr:hypothetical protein [Leptospira kanakyensis]MCW7470073.1 hypothetical protein [Leptospira kanakyensis]